jgi:cardiolipin synthase
MPEDGIASVVNAVDETQSSLDIKMSPFTEPMLVEDVIAAHRRGVKARVMLNPAWCSGESEAASHMRYTMIRYTECGDPD